MIAFLLRRSTLELGRLRATEPLAVAEQHRAILDQLLQQRHHFQRRLVGLVHQQNAVPRCADERRVLPHDLTVFERGTGVSEESVESRCSWMYLSRPSTAMSLSASRFLPTPCDRSATAPLARRVGLQHRGEQRVVRRVAEEIRSGRHQLRPRACATGTVCPRTRSQRPSSSTSIVCWATSTVPTCPFPHARLLLRLGGGQTDLDQDVVDHLARGRRHERREHSVVPCTAQLLRGRLGERPGSGTARRVAAQLQLRASAS